MCAAQQGVVRSDMSRSTSNFSCNDHTVGAWLCMACRHMYYRDRETDIVMVLKKGFACGRLEG